MISIEIQVSMSKVKAMVMCWRKEHRCFLVLIFQMADAYSTRCIYDEDEYQFKNVFLWRFKFICTLYEFVHHRCPFLKVREHFVIELMTPFYLGWIIKYRIGANIFTIQREKSRKWFLQFIFLQFEPAWTLNWMLLSYIIQCCDKCKTFCHS